MRVEVVCGAVMEEVRGAMMIFRDGNAVTGVPADHKVPPVPRRLWGSSQRCLG
ncbi:Uncharacterised protein [Actinomadura madurae]|nr:Uncharacterised protein [Actinomadura madurae]